MKTDQRRIDPAAQRVFDIMQPRVTAEELQRIKDAYFLAQEAHCEQKRKTGEPYIIHPIAVATIAAEELELDANTVCAAFLHDVVEDTAYTLDDIRERFGDDVAFLVDAVTKRKKSEYVSIAGRFREKRWSDSRIMTVRLQFIQDIARKQSSRHPRWETT